MPIDASELGQNLTARPESGALSGLYDVFLFVAILGFSAAAMLALALAAPLALAVSAITGAVSTMFAGAKRRSGWREATPV